MSNGPRETLDTVLKAVRGKAGLFVLPVVLALGALLLLTIARGIFLVRVEPGQIGVRQDNVFGGGITDEDFGAGYRLRIVGIHKFYTLDERFSFIHFADTNTLNIRTHDHNVVTVDVSVPFRIRPGEGYLLVREGLHVNDAYKERTRNITVGVLRNRLGEMNAHEFYDTDARLRVTAEALDVLNAELREFHTEAERIYIRAVYFRDEYEEQLQHQQLNDQQALLDQAEEAVAHRQQLLDNYVQQTSAMENSRNARWDQWGAILERVYAVGFTEADLPSLVEATLVGQGIADDPNTDVDETAQASERELARLRQRLSDPAYQTGVEGITADTNRHVAELEGRANSLRARYEAEAERVIAEIEFERERRVNELLSSAGGRALVALEAAERIQFNRDLVFHSSAIPFILDLDGMARYLMGE